jgi:hypothetical protein
MKFLAATLIVFVRLTVTPSYALDDHGDTFQTATALTSTQVTQGTFVPGNIEEPGDIDYFSFVVDPQYVDYLFVIETTIPTNDPYSDTYLRLIGTDGSTQLAADDDGGGGSESKIQWASPAAGTYYVEVSQTFSTDTGTYSVSVLRAGPAPPDDHGDTPSEGTLLVVNDPATAGTTELPGDTDYFQFIARPGRFYDIETSGLGEGSDTILALIAHDEETVLGTDDQGGREFNASRILWVAPPDIAAPTDVFYLKVSQFLPSAQGDYSIAIQSPGIPSELITDGSETSEGDLESAGDVDAYSFPGVKNKTIEVNLATTNSPNNFEMRLLDPDGISVLTEQDDLESRNLEQKIKVTAEHYLLVTEPYAGGAYSLSATMEAPAPNPDVNGDGVVDASDVLTLMDHYLETMPE